MSKDEFKQYMYQKTMPSGANASSLMGEIDSMRGEVSTINKYIGASFGGSQKSSVDKISNTSFGLQAINDRVKTIQIKATKTFSAGDAVNTAITLFEVTSSSYGHFCLGKQTIDLLLSSVGFLSVNSSDSIDIWVEQKVSSNTYGFIGEPKTFTSTSTLRNPVIDEFQSGDDYRVRIKMSADRGAVQIPYNFLLRDTD